MLDSNHGSIVVAYGYIVQWSLLNDNLTCAIVSSFITHWNHGQLKIMSAYHYTVTDTHAPWTINCPKLQSQYVA